jgi:5'-phosphate synthase pdxT subunit
MPAIGDEPLHGVFIRAPVVSEVGPRAEVLAVDADGQPIAVRQGRVLATAFHPELTGDRRLHRLLVEMVGAKSVEPS